MVRRVHGCVRLRSRIIFYKRGSNVAFKRERRVYPFYEQQMYIGSFTIGLQFALGLEDSVGADRVDEAT